MNQLGQEGLAVVDDGRLVGMITRDSSARSSGSERRRVMPARRGRPSDDAPDAADATRASGDEGPA